MDRKALISVVFTVAFLVMWGGGRVTLDALQRYAEAAPQPLSPLAGNGLRAVFEAAPPAGAGRASLGLLTDNAQAWARRWTLLASASQSIDVNYFILKQDVFGASFLGHLIERARAGVRIRVLLDAMGTQMSRDVRGNDYLDALVNTEGVKVRIYRPLLTRYIEAVLTLHPAFLLASDHDKILVFDRTQALIGGRNISVEYFAPLSDDARAFRDTDVLLQGRAAANALVRAFEAQYESDNARRLQPERLDLVEHGRDLRLAYEAMNAWLHGRPLSAALVQAIEARELPWLAQLRTLPGLRGILPAAARATFEPTEVRLIDSYTRYVAADDPLSRTLARLVRAARREILIQTPYLVLPEPAVALLEEAGRRGVAITILTNSPASSDNALSQAIFLKQWPRLLARVPGLRLFVAGDHHNLHSKVAVFDGQVALIGTYNLDPLSMALNSEIAVLAWSRPVAARLAGAARGLLAQGPPTIYEYRIRRRADGRPLLGPDGAVAVAFGPRQHSEPESWPALHAYLKVAGAVQWMLDESSAGVLAGGP